MVAPFSFHALRMPNGESTYDAFDYLFGSTYTTWFKHFFDVPALQGPSEIRWVAQSLQIGCALAAAAMRPRNFDDLVNAFLFATLGYMSFSVFYSPQWVLWILPLVCFSASRIMLATATFLSWLTYIYFPISYDLMQARHPSLFKVVVVAVSLLRLIMMFLAVKGRYGRQTPVQSASDAHSMWAGG
jgi:hypothetical protein